MKYVLLFVKAEQFDRDLQAMSHTDRERAVDLGCHVGTFSLPAAALGHRVIAVDASSNHARIVSAAGNINGFGDKLTVIQRAVSNVQGRVRFLESGLFGSVLANPKDTSTAIE